MRKPTLLIADRDSSSREKLRKLIQQQGYPAVCYQCCNGPETIRYINALQPDLVLISIDLPGKNGFDVLDSVVTQPPVIFLADSAAFAAKAFDYHAIDYLVTPFTAERIALALRRSEVLTAAPQGDQFGQVSRTRFPLSILVEKGKRLMSIRVNKITHLKADKDYTWIHTVDGESYLSTNGIGQLERKLNPQHFIRIHRSYIVNIDHIQELYRDISKLFVALPNATAINVGRNYIPAIKELMF